jgi:hypothetical protein
LSAPHDPMAATTKFSFLIGQPPQLIGPGHLQWAAALPRFRYAVNKEQKVDAKDGRLRYGDYFQAAAGFLSRNRFEVPTMAAAALLKREVEPDDIKHLSIHLAKHGAFYHPARVTLHIGGIDIPMALNVAVSQEGRSVLFQEYANLNRLNETYGKAYLPRVFGCSDSQTDDMSAPVMFAAQWLDGYHEFHLTAAPPAGDGQWVVWDDENGHWMLSQTQVRELYHRAARMLTYYFNPFSLEAILDWHHAAGDFVVRCMGEGLDVRLITVRRYAPLVSLDEGEALTLRTLLEVMVLFFVMMSLRMRLDRLDGVGDLVWAPEHIIQPIWDGFVSGLDRMATHQALPDEFKQGVLSFVRAHDSATLADLCREIVERLPPGLQEAGVMRSHLQAHAVALAQCIQDR